MKIIFVQLPIPRYGCEFVHENDPVAAGYLTGYFRKYSDNPDIQIELMDRTLMDYGGERAIINTILTGNYTVVAFTVYVWNATRTKDIAKQLKTANPAIILIAGGPEICADNHVITETSVFDYLVTGEGEQAFHDLILHQSKRCKASLTIPGTAVRTSQGYGFNLPGTRIEDLDSIPNPYVAGLIPLSGNGFMRLESSRGCTQHCTYCFYTQHYKTVKFFSNDYIAAVLKHALNHDAKELAFTDPNFNDRPGLTKFLQFIADLNKQNTFSINVEGVAEKITPGTASLMYSAGIREVEAGLQTINDKSRKTTKRTGNPEKFASGVQSLIDTGIEPIVDMILGLPYDTKDDFHRTADFIFKHQFQDFVQLFPLSILPGTPLRAQADQFGYRYQQYPPYNVYENKWVSNDDIRETYLDLQEEFGHSFDPESLPNLLLPPRTLKGVEFYDVFQTGYVDKCIIDCSVNPEHSLNILDDKTDHITNTLSNFFSIWLRFFTGTHTNLETQLKLFLANVSSANPHTVYELIVEIDQPVTLQRIQNIYESVTPCVTHYANFYYHYKWGSDALHHVRRYIILPLSILETKPSFVQDASSIASLIFRIEFISQDQFKKLLLSLDPYLDYFVLVKNRDEFNPDDTEDTIIQAGHEPESFSFSCGVL